MTAEGITFRVPLPTGIDVLVYPSSQRDPHPDPARPHFWKVHATYEAPCTVTGKPDFWGLIDEHRCKAPPDEEKQASWAIEAALRALRHEVAEHIGKVVPAVSPHTEPGLSADATYAADDSLAPRCIENAPRPPSDVGLFAWMVTFSIAFLITLLLAARCIEWLYGRPFWPT